MLEQTSEKSLPDLLISGCSGVLFGPVLAGEQTKPVLAREQIKKSASSAGTRSRRTAASNHFARFYVWFSMLSAGWPPFPPIPLHGRSTAAPSLLSPSVAARFISPSFCPCGGTIQPVLSVAEWIGPSCAQCPPNAPSAHLSFRAQQDEFFFPFAPAKGRPAQREISLPLSWPCLACPRTKWSSETRNWRRR